MYSDRIHHALAFAAKHHPERVSRYDGQSCLIRASSVALILARYGADESTIVAGILKHLADAVPASRLQSLERDIDAKFGTPVAVIVAAATEPRFDLLGRERTWKTCRFEYLAQIAEATPLTVDICVAEELHRIGAALVSIRRLGIEYLETIGLDNIGGPNSVETVWWLGILGDTLEHHPTWNRPAMLEAFRVSADDLRRRLRSG
ncbi:MAG: HD domain-containing protein [Gemmatimonadales bacterium]